MTPTPKAASASVAELMSLAQEALSAASSAAHDLAGPDARKQERGSRAELFAAIESLAAPAASAEPVARHAVVKDRLCVCGEPWRLGTLHRVDGPCQDAPSLRHAKELAAGLCADFATKGGFIYRATTASGAQCHFGEESTAKAWAGERGRVESIPWKTTELVAVPPATAAGEQELPALPEPADFNSPTLASELSGWRDFLLAPVLGPKPGRPLRVVLDASISALAARRLPAGGNETNTRMWAVNVLGPDDLYAVPDLMIADAVCVVLNAQFKRQKMDDLAKAVVIEWPHGYEEWKVDSEQFRLESLLSAATPAQAGEGAA